MGRRRELRGDIKRLREFQALAAVTYEEIAAAMKYRLGEPKQVERLFNGTGGTSLWRFALLAEFFEKRIQQNFKTPMCIPPGSLIDRSRNTLCDRMVAILGLYQAWAAGPQLFRESAAPFIDNDSFWLSPGGFPFCGAFYGPSEIECYVELLVRQFTRAEENPPTIIDYVELSSGEIVVVLKETIIHPTTQAPMSLVLENNFCFSSNGTVRKYANKIVDYRALECFFHDGEVPQGYDPWWSRPHH